jgi:hypothetical protein
MIVVASARLERMRRQDAAQARGARRTGDDCHLSPVSHFQALCFNLRQTAIQTVGEGCAGGRRTGVSKGSRVTRAKFVDFSPLHLFFA